MKKIFALSLLFLVFTAAASAQCRPRHNRVTRAERMDLRRDAVRLRHTEMRAHADGYVGPVERRRINRQKHEIRREAFIYRHNRNNRII